MGDVLGKNHYPRSGIKQWMPFPLWQCWSPCSASLGVAIFRCPWSSGLQQIHCHHPEDKCPVLWPQNNHILQEACSGGDGGVSDGGLETEQTCQSGCCPRLDRLEEQVCVCALPAVLATQVLPALTLNLQTHIHPASLFSLPSPALWFPSA